MLFIKVNLTPVKMMPFSMVQAFSNLLQVLCIIDVSNGERVSKIEVQLVSAVEVQMSQG